MPESAEQTEPDYFLKSPDGGKLSAAFVYSWDRWLDGPDLRDAATPDENPGACVVTALDQGLADWIIVTNGKLWRVYSRQAHARPTNFYEVDLVEALTASGDTDPNEAFRYWWLFFKADAFKPLAEAQGCWLDAILHGSREFAKRLGERLKDRVFLTIFRHLAKGFLVDRKQRLGHTKGQSEEELADVFEATLTLLYRLLFLLYAESRDLLPIREDPYKAASLKNIKEEIAAKAGVAESDVPENLGNAYSEKETTLYDRLCRLFKAMDKGEPTLNVPTYNGGLFNTTPDDSDNRDQEIGRFLRDHKVPDLYLALAIDRLARDQDDISMDLIFIDYKSLEVRHLGSIYEGLLEFKLKIAQDDLTTQTDKKGEKYIPLSQAKTKRGKRAEVVVQNKDVYLSNDKAERKASGSYYTPDPIVEYIVANTVGPVLAEKLEALRGDFRKVRKTFDMELQKSEAYPSSEVRSGKMDHRQWAAAKSYAAHKDLVEQVFDFKVLDPAMGSGHFLVEAVDFITDRLLKFLNQFPKNPVNFALDQTRKNIRSSLEEQGVTVDPDKLTDINLLKRHILKRCIYGVDFNPMAVELAKVSLWLDAFTLGAPLNFLDHHLRCGNSLIGTTFKDLEDLAEQFPLGAWNTEPLLRAIKHVLFVSKMADATASEVNSSIQEYFQARQLLSGYQIMLDMLTVPFFGLPQGVQIVAQGVGLDLGNRDRFLATLNSDQERQWVLEGEKIARRPDHRFFHWEIEFPEVFFGFIDADQRQIRHKDKIEAGSAGFDCVVGNPPYDELSEHAAGRELPEKQYLKTSPLYADALGGRLNVFRPFVLRSMAVLRNGGKHSFIVPMALLADQFTVSLRRRLLNEGWLRSVAAFPQKDDPHNRVFFEAKLSTCVFVAERISKPDGRIVISTYPGNSFSDTPKKCDVLLTDIKRLDPSGFSLPTVQQADVDMVNVIYSKPRTARFEEVAHSQPGEIMFNAAFDYCINDEPPGDVVLRGAHIGRYVFNDDPKQGEPKYLDRKKYLAARQGADKSQHYRLPRLGYQRGSAVDNWRRIIATLIQSGYFCSDTVAYFVESKYDLSATLALFNSAVCEWRFNLTSTNNHVNAYEVDALPVPRFARLKSDNSALPAVDWNRWEAILGREESGVTSWEQAVLVEMKQTPTDAWPNSIHDALAAAGKEMSRLGEERQRLTNDFAAWLIETLKIDEGTFTGITYLRGGQATFDQMGWDGFQDLLRRNRRSCGVDAAPKERLLQKQYAEASAKLTRNRTHFSALDSAIDRIVWQLVGLKSDGSLP